MLSNNNLSSVNPKLFAEAVLHLKDVDLRSSFLRDEQVEDRFTILSLFVPAAISVTKLYNKSNEKFKGPRGLYCKLEKRLLDLN